MLIMSVFNIKHLMLSLNIQNLDELLPLMTWSKHIWLVWLIVFNVTFDNIFFNYIVTVSFIGGGNQSTLRKPLTCRKSQNKVYHIMLYQVHSSWGGFELSTLVMIGTDCTGCCKSNYDTITTMTSPRFIWAFCWI